MNQSVHEFIAAKLGSVAIVLRFLKETYPACELSVRTERSNEQTIVCTTRTKHKCGVKELRESV